MKYKTTFLVAAFAFANAHAVAARQAEIKSFSPVAGDFKLLEPGYQATPVAERTGYRPADPEIQMGQEFAALAPEPIPPSTTIDVVQTVRIPTWMRGSLRARGLSSNGTENLHKAARLKAAGHSGRARSGG